MHSVLAWLIPLISSTDCHVSSISLPHEMALSHAKPHSGRSPTGEEQEIGKQNEEASGNDPRSAMLQAIRF